MVRCVLQSDKPCLELYSQAPGDDIVPQLKQAIEKPPVIYQAVHEDPLLTIALFTFPPGAEIPIHDHPDMTVYSKM